VALDVKEKSATGELAFGHGFMPRIGDGNYKAVDRCLGPANLFAETLVLPWPIVAGPWATRKPELVSTMREHGTRTSVDTMSWRFRYEAAFGVAKLGSTSWAPTAAVSIGSRDEVGRLVE